MKYWFTPLCTALLLCLLAIFACTNAPKGELDGSTRGESIIPVDFPELDIPGFAFPRDSNTVKGWIESYDTLSQYQHAWGIWTGLTTLTDQKGSFGDALRVFETWLTPEEIIHAMNKNDKGLLTNGSDIRSNRANLRVPRQFGHGGLGLRQDIDSVFEAHSYSPSASAYALKNKVFSAIQLAKYAEKGNSIPPFPDNAITTKPAYKILRASKGDSIFSIPVWPPDPSSGYPKPTGYKESTWNNSIQINIKAKKSDPANRIYALRDFIYYQMNKEDAEVFNARVEPTRNPNVSAGDIAILVGMHVTTREIANWTWQTYWWVPDAAKPAFPSSKAIADARPAQLTGAARHYAMSITYYMVNPTEPYATSEIVTGKPYYGFNPYLEAKFDSFKPGELSKVYIDAKTSVPTGVGIRSNCMSCHRMAAVSKVNFQDAPGFVGDAYISQTNPVFKDMLLTDFAWSVVFNVDTTGLAAYLKQKTKK